MCVINSVFGASEAIIAREAGVRSITGKLRRAFKIFHAMNRIARLCHMAHYRYGRKDTYADTHICAKIAFTNTVDTFWLTAGTRGLLPAPQFFLSVLWDFALAEEIVVIGRGGAHTFEIEFTRNGIDKVVSKFLKWNHLRSLRFFTLKSRPQDGYVQLFFFLDLD